ncbi:MAG TPA: NHL repeat-containing protein [Acidobacteriaceae bacterium]|nr:NHL repeat-containing protein [Acidobacteriaceae bacterium]
MIEPRKARNAVLRTVLLLLVTANAASLLVSCGSDTGTPPPKTSHLAVADGMNNRILIYKTPLRTDESASIVIGQASFTETLPNQGGSAPTAATLSNPGGMAMDSAGNLWVADTGNCRVLEFKPPFTSGMKASVVLGQSRFDVDMPQGPGCVLDPATLPSGMGPSWVAVDRQGNVWVVDVSGERITEYVPPFTNGMAASIAIGQKSLDDSYECNGGSFGPDGQAPPPTASTLCYPAAAGFDSQGNLWVTDSSNNRVLEFVPPFSTGMAASLQLGSPSSSTSGSNCYSWGGSQSAFITSSSFCAPSAVEFDGNGDLWVGDMGYNRVLEFIPPFTAGMDASLVIGASSFTQPPQYQELPATANLLNGVYGISFDGNGNLLVSDGGNSRILLFRLPFSNGMGATTVIGQPDMSSTSRGPSWECAPAAANTLCGGGGILSF